jgi:hypothetical protein
MVRELFKLAEKSQKEQTKPAGHGRLQQWYFFMVAAFWMYFRHDPMHSLLVYKAAPGSARGGTRHTQILLLTAHANKEHV